MDTVVCDEFLLDSANTGLTPCGVVVALPDNHKAFHVFLEGWMAWLVDAGLEAFKKDKDKDGDAPKALPSKPDPHNRT